MARTLAIVEYAQPARIDHHPLADVLAGIGRIAVVDMESTGLYRSGRVVEIAIATMAQRGRQSMGSTL